MANYIKVDKDIITTNSYQEPVQFGEWYEVCQIGINGIDLISENSFFDLVVPFEIEHFKPYWLLYVIWSDGDSFGHADGCWFEAVGLYDKETYDIGVKNKERIEEHYKDSEGRDKFSIDLLDHDENEYMMHVPWTGYFESMDCVELEEVHLITDYT